MALDKTGPTTAAYTCHAYGTNSPYTFPISFYREAKMRNLLTALAIGATMVLTADVFVRREKSLALALAKAVGLR